MVTSTQMVQGTAQLVFDSIAGITSAVEGMHETIARRPLPWSPPQNQPGDSHGAIAAAVYSSIRVANDLLRQGLRASTGLLPDALPNAQSPEVLIRSIAAVNGAYGDHLEATDNPLATAMHLRTQHQQPLDQDATSVAVGQASGHLVVLVHGLGLSELSWNGKGVPGIGQRLQDALDITPLYLRYNTGRHISTNGQEFAQQLEQLCVNWPVPVESLSLIGHSMGGLIIRSACWYAQQSDSQWLSHLQHVVCLGTPHHGSPVAKVGLGLNAAMQRIAYTRPLTFGRSSSAGIRDLRHGDLLDEDWRDYHSAGSNPRNRQPVPFIPDVEYHFAAATIGRDKHDPLGSILGDLLVRLDSATGSHRDDLQHLHITADNCRVFHEKTHLDLLDDPEVHQQILDWFRP